MVGFSEGPAAPMVEGSYGIKDRVVGLGLREVFKITFSKKGQTELPCDCYSVRAMDTKGDLT